ncbi:MAG: hypothetical protein L6Q38_18470 [Nitrospira sp.]|nr:hypothetical protein [Nitrospira sp.]
MPKDDIDPEDPMELCGVAIVTDEDTSNLMTECFIEEFLRLGYGPTQILGLFRNPHYVGPNLVLQNRGERFVREKIAEVFGWWGHPISLREEPAGAMASTSAADSILPTPQTIEFDTGLADPGGAAIPRLQT